MKISVDYSVNNNQPIWVDSAEHLSSYKIKIKFNDGMERLVDFEHFLSKSLHPSIQKYLNIDYFSKFEVTDGNLNWNDHDLIFPIGDLYDGKVDA